LTSGAEIVRRHARDEARPPIGVEQKQLRIGPDIGRVAGDKNRRVAEEPNSTPRGMAP
jgi:hypothetical protein